MVAGWFSSSGSTGLPSSKDIGRGGVMAIANYNRSIPELLADVVNGLTFLVRKETQLARVEMSEKIGDFAIGIGLLVGGSVLLIPALVILLQSAVAGLVAAGIGTAWAALIVGGVTLLVGLILLGFGVSRLKAARPISRPGPSASWSVMRK
jgi:hypothetical protein